jgi:hypothetical protein
VGLNRGIMLWLVTTVGITTGGVCTALLRCAVAEAAIRFASRLRYCSPIERAEATEEWLRVVEDMRPAERPSYAGGLLWTGLRYGVPEALLRRRMIAEFLASNAGMLSIARFGYRIPVYGVFARCRYFIRQSSLTESQRRVTDMFQRLDRVSDQIATDLNDLDALSNEMEVDLRVVEQAVKATRSTQTGSRRRTNLRSLRRELRPHRQRLRILSRRNRSIRRRLHSARRRHDSLRRRHELMKANNRRLRRLAARFNS